MIEGFKKAIQNFILPRFPWVSDYKVEVGWEEDGMKHINVVYYLEVDDTGVFTVDANFGRLEETTESVFGMMNDGSISLNNVFFRQAKK